MLFPTAIQNKIRRLYHWQSFDSLRFDEQMMRGTVYCSSPQDFNDPWDCRLFFNTNFLADRGERHKHIKWAVEVCRQHTQMSELDIQRMCRELQDPDVLERYVRNHSLALQEDVLNRYRVYCLCPDVGNILMWAHYGNSHSGICLEFNVDSDTICGALQVQYRDEFPMTAQYSMDECENLLPLLAKARAWEYEKEYRLIAHDAGNRISLNTLRTSSGHLTLSKGALRSVIVGYRGPYEQVRTIVKRYQPEIQVLRMHLVPNRYQLDIRP